MSPYDASAVPSDISPAPADDPPADDLWVERTGTRTYTARSARGAEVAIGPTSAGAVFTPGELLKVALAACAAMSSDQSFAHRLGDDYQATVRVGSVKHETEDRYTDFTEYFDVDLSSLDDDARDRLITVVRRAIAASCTVGLTVQNSATVETEFH